MKAKFNFDKIRELISKRRLSLAMRQEELGKLIGLSSKSAGAIIHRIENGPRNISLDEYVTLCVALGIEPWRPLMDKRIVIPITDKQAQMKIISLERENIRLKKDLAMARRQIEMVA